MRFLVAVLLLVVGTGCDGDGSESGGSNLDCRRGEPCNSGFECRQNEVGSYECLPPLMGEGGSDGGGGISPPFGGEGGIFPPPEVCSTNCPDIDWIRIEGGSFMMGSPNGVGDSNEHPQHEVNVPSFSLAQSETTVAQYRACVDAGHCTEPSTEYNTCTWSPIAGEQEDHPINCVDWSQARAFSQWVGGDLPSEAEWEFAARSRGQDFAYPWGDEAATCERAVMNDGGGGCGRGSTWPVCSKPQGHSEQGLCDLSGNVYEWVLDEYVDNYNRAPDDGSPVCSEPTCSQNVASRRVNRGGSWYGDADILRAADRGGNRPGYRYDYLGFRARRTQSP